MKTYYHTRHTCGHSVWWNNKEHAFVTGFHPCPWCGGASGSLSTIGGRPVDKIEDNAVLVDKDNGEICAFRRINADGTVPGFDDDFGERVTLQHRADNSCCPQ